MTWKFVKFEDVFAFKKKSNYKAKDGLDFGKYPFYTSSTGVSKFINDYDYYGKSLIFGTGGKASIHFCSDKFSTTADCIVAQPKNDKLIETYFYYLYLRYNIHLLENGFRGAGLKHISKNYISKIRIPLPPLQDQIQIVEILSKAENLILKRKESIHLLDDLLKSTFLEMFGDPVKNEKGWEKKKLNEVCSKITDGTHDTPERIEKGIKFITGKHIVPFFIDFNNSDYVTEEEHKIIFKRCNPEFGDILYTNIGVNLGTAAINSVHYEFSMKNVALLKNHSSMIESHFLVHLLNFTKYKNLILRKASTGGAQKFMSLKQIRNIMILVPPLTLQAKFSEIVKKVESIKTKYESDLTELDNLYGSLSQKALKGELDFINNEVEN